MRYLAASISASGRTSCRRTFGYIVSVSITSAKQQLRSNRPWKTSRSNRVFMRRRGAVHHLEHLIFRDLPAYRAWLRLDAKRIPTANR